MKVAPQRDNLNLSHLQSIYICIVIYLYIHLYIYIFLLYILQLIEILPSFTNGP